MIEEKKDSIKKWDWRKDHDSGRCVKLLRSPGIDSASLCFLAGRYDNPIPTRFLAPLAFSKIPAQNDKKWKGGKGLYKVGS
jgi:hypothetical protein